ncbi:hypothetical protein, partial [Massilia brevitalea]|uniref:hypothetical protein n=1 Tax=Massilia brevitalea TaxID=442526 RepID=UPI00273A0C3B
MGSYELVTDDSMVWVRTNPPPTLPWVWISYELVTNAAVGWISYELATNAAVGFGFRVNSPLALTVSMDSTRFARRRL